MSHDKVDATLLLMLTIYKHLNDEQFTEIMLDYLEQLDKQKNKENALQ